MCDPAELCLNRRSKLEKKKGGRSPLSVSPSRLISLTARCFFACGLDVAWNERTRSVKEWEGANIPPHPVPGRHGHVGRVKQGIDGKSQRLASYSSGPVTVAASDPCTPGCRGAKLSYTRLSRRRCCISCRCRCAPMCSCHTRRRLRPHSLAFWLWYAHPSRPYRTRPPSLC